MNGIRDDRVLPLTRWSAAVLVLALLAGGITLYGFPGSTVPAVPRAAAGFPTPAARWGFLAALGVALALTASPLLAVRRPSPQAAPTAR